MNYKKHYYRILHRGLARTEKSSDMHSHHIIPKYMGDFPFLCLLTKKEHVIIHRLLYKSFDRNGSHLGSLFAYNMLIHKIDYNTPASGYSLPPRTNEHRKNLSRSLRNLYASGHEPWNKGLFTGPLSNEHKEKIGLGQLGKKKPPRNSHHRKNYSKAQKIRYALGAKPRNKGKHQKPTNRWVFMGNKELYIREEKLQEYIDAGWLLGRTGKHILKNTIARGRMWINKNNKTKMIYPEDFEKYNKQGWSKGRK